jgi:hypothetical protein
MRYWVLVVVGFLGYDAVYFGRQIQAPIDEPFARNFMVNYHEDAGKSLPRTSAPNYAVS